MKITGNIITLNEAHNISACIESLQLVCDEIIVVDSNSTDNTVEIAQSLGATVVSQKYLGDGPQKNVVLAHAKYDWILSLDADERVDPQMAQSINSLKSQSQQHDSYSFKRKNYIGQRWIKYCGWYPDACVRLYRKERAQFKNVAGHSSVESQSNQLLAGHIIHFSYKNYHDLLHKTNRFSTRGANMLLQKGKKVNAFSPVLHFISSFIRKYFFKLGVLQGLDGFTISLTASINSYMKYAKYREMLKEGQKSDSLWE